MPVESPPLEWLGELQAQLAECPEPPPPTPQRGAIVQLVPTSLDPIQLELKPGYSVRDQSFCWWLDGAHYNEGEMSEQVSLGGVDPNCIAVPEAPLSGMLMAGVVVLALIRRLSGQRRDCGGGTDQPPLDAGVAARTQSR